MIILRPQETQLLPSKIGVAPVQYAGEGQGLVQAGTAVAHVADKAVQLMTALNDQQQKVHATNTLNLTKSKFEDGVNDYWYKWDQDHVQKGELPDVALKAFSDQLESYDKAAYTEFKSEYASNRYVHEAMPAVLSELKKDAMVRARAYAHKSFIEIGRTQTQTSVDSLMDSALLAEATGDHDGYIKKALTIQQTYEQQVANGLFTKAEANKRIQETMQVLEEKRGFQQIARDPGRFLEDYHSKKYANLDPKVAKEFVTAAEQGLARQVELKDRERKLEAESAKTFRISLKNELLTLALTDPAKALAQVSTMGNRLALGEDYDNTLSTLRTMANPDARHNNDATLRQLNREIERNPDPKTYAHLDAALQRGDLKGDTFMSMSHRLTERIEKMKDKNESDRLKRTNLAVSTYQPMLRVTGINDFDSTSNTAQQLYEDELRAKIEADPKADPMVEGKRLLNKYREYIDDTALTSAEAIASKYGFKSAAEVTQAFTQGIITRAESDVMIWFFSKDKTDKPKPTSANQSNMVKKK